MYFFIYVLPTEFKKLVNEAGDFTVNIDIVTPRLTTANIAIRNGDHLPRRSCS